VLDHNAGRHAEDALTSSAWTERARERAVRALSAATAVFCRVRLGPEFRVERISPSVRRLTGYGVDDFLAEPELIRRVVHPDDRLRLESILGDPAQAAAQTGLRVVHRDGRILQTEHVALIVHDNRGDAIAIELLVRDVTGFGAETDSDSENADGGADDDSSAVAYLADRDGFLRVSTGIDQLTGFSADEWMRQSALWRERLHPDDRARVQFLATAGAAGQPWQAEYRWVARDGRVIWIRQASAPICRAGEVVCVQGLMLDSTPLKQTEPVGAADRMDAIGKLAGVVAHDFNNLLTIVLGYAEMLLETFRDSEPSRGNLIEIKNAAEAAARITSQLLATSGRQALSLTRADVNEVIRGAAETLHQLAGGEIDLRFDLGPDVPAVDIDVRQFERVLRNLVSDAREALPNGGYMRIGTRTAVRTEGPEIVLTVWDSRPRPSNDALATMFEPSLATKKLPRGGGLNRAAVHGIVLQMGGRILADSPPSGGLLYQIRLPVKTDHAE
jgi:PAS domain S-box-containing protein